MIAPLAFPLICNVTFVTSITKKNPSSVTYVIVASVSRPTWTATLRSMKMAICQVRSLVMFSVIVFLRTHSGKCSSELYKIHFFLQHCCYCAKFLFIITFCFLYGKAIMILLIHLLMISETLLTPQNCIR